MALYLDEQTRPYLKMVMKQRIRKSDKDFVAKRILGAIEIEEDRLETQANCEHIEGKYKGRKTCCSLCQSYFKKSHGFSWALEEENDK